MGDNFRRLASLQSSSHSQLNSSYMTTGKVRGQRLLWIVSGHRRWFESHGLLKCQLDSWSVIRNRSKLLEKCVDTVAFVLIIYLCCFLPCVCSMRKECLLVEHRHLPASSENTSCVAKQHLIYCCVQPCGDATAPPVYQDTPLRLDMATHTMKLTLKQSDRWRKSRGWCSTCPKILIGIHELYLWKQTDGYKSLFETICRKNS